ERYLPDGTQAKLRASVTSKKVISLSSLEKFGLDASLDEQNLSLDFKIPPKIRKEGEFHLVGITPTGEKIVGPAPFSGYVNTRVGQAFSYPSGGTNATGPGTRQPLTADIQSVTNVRGWLLQSGAGYTENLASPWRRSDTSMVHDDESSMVRYTAGDLPIVTRGFQSTAPIGGFS